MFNKKNNMGEKSIKLPEDFPEVEKINENKSIEEKSEQEEQRIDLNQVLINFEQRIQAIESVLFRIKGAI